MKGRNRKAKVVKIPYINREQKRKMNLIQICKIVATEKRNKLKRKIWNKGILLWWYRLWVRSDEHHMSLSIDVDAAQEMTVDEYRLYLDDILRRRSVAHERDLSRENLQTR